MSEAWITYTYLNETANQTLFFYGGESVDSLIAMAKDRTTQDLCMVGGTYSNGFPKLNSNLTKPLNGSSEIFVTVINGSSKYEHFQKFKF